MILEPLPGASLSSIESVARELATEIANVQGTTGALREKYGAYIAWANKGVQKLRKLVTAESLEGLILSRRYWLLQSIADQADTKSVSYLVDVELLECEKALEELLAELTDAHQRWARPGRCVVPDTSFYIHHLAKLEEVELAPLLNVWEEPIRIFVPLLVIEELDRLKRSGKEVTRWRSGYTLAVLERLLSAPSSIGVIRPKDFEPLQHGGSPRGAVTIEVFMDPPGHVRLPVSDDEIVDRALSIQAFARQPVTLLTCDTSQTFRGRHVGLRVVKVSTEGEGGA